METCERTGCNRKPFASKDQFWFCCIGCQNGNEHTVRCDQRQEMLPAIWLDDDYADAVLVKYNGKDQTLDIGPNNYTKTEALKLRDFINAHFEDDE
ncbi:hypothetical protein GCM10018783_74130 [Streptomyces griseosporeus]|nr:hypothetical protein GCM10018783_74130 [Streptomyces griseosporeus]